MGFLNIVRFKKFGCRHQTKIRYSKAKKIGFFRQRRPTDVTQQLQIEFLEMAFEYTSSFFVLTSILCDLRSLVTRGNNFVGNWIS